MSEYQFKFLSDDYREIWHELVAKNPASGFHQSFYFSDMRKGLRWIPYKVGLFDSSDTLQAGAIIYQYFLKKNESFLYIPQGPVLDYEDEDKAKIQWDKIVYFCQELKKQSPDAGINLLRVEPHLKNTPHFMKENGWGKSPRNDVPKSTTFIDLDLSEENILANMKQKCRYNIRLAEKKGVTVRGIDKVGETDIEAFYSLYSATVKRNDFEGKPEWGFKNLLKNCWPILKIFIAEHDGDPLAMALLVCFGDRVTYFYGASSDHKKELMGPYLLHFEIIRWAKRNAYKIYDFWGISPLNAKDHAWKGLSQFKLQFGGERADYIGAYGLQLSGIAKP